jgi:ADP-heptose:LPS heptosyltransferase
VNVLLIRADGIGDALACAPLVAALRDAGHTLGVVLGVRNRDIFAQRAFANVHVLERIPWPRHGSTPASRRVALAQARAAQYDVALVASEEVEAYAFGRDARVPRRIGFVNGLVKPLKTLYVRTLLTAALTRPASAARAREHEVETLFRLGATLSAEATPTRDPDRLRPLLLDEPATPHGAIVLQVSRKLADEGLDTAAYEVLARTLAARGHEVLALGDERELVDAVARASGVQARSDLDLAAWKSAIGGALALVTADSGAAHVAGMLGVPCVDCFAASRAVAQEIVRWRPWTSRYRSLVLDRTAGPDATGAAIAAALEGVLA